MRAKTIKRAAILIAVLSLIAMTAFFAQRFQVQRLAQSVAEQADNAAKQGEFEKAQRLYGEHLAVVPDDVEIQIKYADAILKLAPSRKRQLEALQIFKNVVTKFPGREDVRRRQMELKVALGSFRDLGAEADLKVLLGMEKNQADGNLLFLMGRCQEESKNDASAVTWYQKAIKHNAPQKIEAYQRLATMLRNPNGLNEPKAGDQAIDEMVRSAPENYRAYLARGRYYRQFGRLPESVADFQKALKLADDQPEIFLEMARTADSVSGYSEARKVLEAALTKKPASAILYEALANLDLRNGHGDQAVEVLERGLKSSADKGSLQWTLANALAVRGESGKLLLQIEELKKIDFPPSLLQLLTAHYYINTSDFRKARQLLVPLESQAALTTDLKARVSNLLARCYSQLGESGMQQDAYLRALNANPQDITAKLGLIAHMVNEGENERAIKEYRGLVERVPQVSIALARLLITRNLLRPAPQRDWTEIRSLIDGAEKTMPESVEPLILRADFHMARNQHAEAQDEIKRARARFPKNVALWCAQANLMGTQKRFNEAQSSLDEAEKQLGDSVEIRLQRARLIAAKGGPRIASDLNNLSQKMESFSKDDRRRLTTALAVELRRLQDLQGASSLWSRLAEQEPNDVEPWLNLLDLAFLTANSSEIDKDIKQIEQIEGTDGLLGRYCRVRYLIWQAQRTMDEKPQEALQLRTEARVLLNELTSRRADWSVIPLALAQLEQQELRQTGLTAAEIQAKEESIIRSYRRAIDLGQRRSAIVRETVRLLFKNKRGSEALDLLNGISVEAQIASDLGRQAMEFAVNSQDFQRAEEIARKAVTANPADFQERIWLVRVLLASGNQAGAEAAIREAVGLAKGDPDRWITLVQFMLITKQPDKAEKAIKDAEANLPAAQAPLALAQCSELMGKATEGTNDELTKQWYAEAKRWYEKAKADNPDDLSITRRLADFFRRTKQTAEAEAQLNAILKRGSNPQTAETVAWARRTLALTLASSSDRKRVRSALALLESAGKALTDGDGTKVRKDDPEDLRVLVRVLEAQKSVQHNKKAIEVLNSLVSKNLATTEDRFLLARLHEIAGDWPKAREEYRDLNLRTKNSRDLEALNRRPLYLAQFVGSLLRNHKAGDDQSLIEAQELVEELKQLQPDQLSTLVLQVEVDRSSNRVDKAVELIQGFAKRTDLTPTGMKTLAELAEKLDRFELADQLYHRYAALPNTRDGKIMLALFLGRHGHVKEALDICEPLWANSRDSETIAATCIEVVIASNDPPDPAQVDRVSDWLEQAIKQKKDSTFLLVGLGNCRERQGRYDDAKKLYLSVIKHVTGNAVAPSGSNNMIATAYNNLAWLIALKDGQGITALEYINRAIELVGPLPDYLDTRGVIYYLLEKTQLAIDDLENAVKVDPSPSKLFHLAQAYLRANDKEKAKLCLKEAKAKGLDRIRLGPGGLHSLEQAAYQKLLSELGLS